MTKEEEYKNALNAYMNLDVHINKSLRLIGISAIKKQISKKPIFKESDFMGHLYCPNCDKSFDCDEEYYLKYGEWNYCGKCGQKIDWSDGHE